ncbi:MAG: GNAT family N-acetyltransferase [Spirochaetales bacterium]|nr:GNAT family N-acetyltransferase [Spirochaetales bacterium]
MIKLTAKDRPEIYDYLRLNPYLHLYEIGDLDDRLQPFISWYGIRKEGSLKAVICVYEGGEIPTLMAFSDIYSQELYELLINVIEFMPDRFMAHLSPCLENTVERFSTISKQQYYRMCLLETKNIKQFNTEKAVELDKKDISALQDLYSTSYQENWFEPDKININKYFGIYDKNILVAAAGTHSYSEKYSAAALGNIATRIDYRGRGLGASVTAALSESLLKEKLKIGLNVKTNNKTAVSCYLKIGYEIITDFSFQCLEK